VTVTAFKDLDDLFDPGLELPIGGKVYRVEPPSAELGLWCEHMLVCGTELQRASTDEEIEAVVTRLDKPPGDESKSIQARVLGAAYEEMVADGVSWPKIKHAGNTAYVWIVMGEEAAARYWTSVGRPEAVAPNRAARRATSKSTGAASGTRRRASTSGTSSPKTSSRAKASRSSGGTS
jgi:hypothetical protein